MMLRTSLGSMMLVLWLAAAPAASQAAETTAPRPTALLAIPNARVPLDGVLSGGQPTTEQIESAARAGFRTVINLRSETEPGFEWERGSVERLGLGYVSIPIAGGEELTRENVQRVDSALNQALGRGPVLLHCGSGNRIGAVLALREAWLRGAEPEAALRVGRAAGLVGLEGRVREILGLAAEPSPGP